MRNPWLQIPLAEYEGHMALPQVAQAQLLGNVFESMLEKYRPRSVAVLGCAGGNGFERIRNTVTTRVIGVDLNPDYIKELGTRFKDRLPTLELYVGDVQTGEVTFRPVDLVFAGLVLEYLDVNTVLMRILSLLNPGGILSTVVQLPSPTSAAVTPSPFLSIQALEPFMHLVAPVRLKHVAERYGYLEDAARLEESYGGKQFQVQTFRLLTPNLAVNADAPQAARRLP